MSLVLPIAHDFNCSWCYVGHAQALRLRGEFGIKIEWRGYEQYPEGSPMPVANLAPKPESPRPPTPGRMALAYAAEGMEPPPTPPPAIRTHNAHEAVEHAKILGVADALVDRLYRAYWLHGLDIGNLGTLKMLSAGLVDDFGEMARAIEERRYAQAIVPFDEPAYATGVYNIPTFWIGGERYAEQPYLVLRKALLAAVGPQAASPQVYAGLQLPEGPPDRPYVAINMVTTIDGKTITGNRDEAVMDLGSKVDHATMRNIQNAADAVMLGAGSLRSTPGLWYPAHRPRFVVTRSGDLNWKSRFFSDAPHHAYVVAPEDYQLPAGNPGIHLAAGSGEVDLKLALRKMRTELGVRSLLVEGGSELNARMLDADLVDELFLTLAPKVKLGRETPTYAGGHPLPREAVQRYLLVSEQRVGDEVFLRYRRAW
ncbi:MAG: dihydrofolate reductase family protein [Fimbriimonadales bacterium]